MPESTDTLLQAKKTTRGRKTTRQNNEGGKARGLPPLLPSSGLVGLARWEWYVESDDLLFSHEWLSHMAVHEHSPVHNRAGFWLDRAHEEDAPQIQTAVQAARAEHKTKFEVLGRIRRLDDTWAWMLLKGQLEPARKGKPSHFSGFALNVSLLRLSPNFQPQRAWNDSLSYRSMLANSPDFIVRLDKELFPLYANSALDKYLPKASDELGDSTPQELGIDPDHMAFLAKSVAEVFATGLPVRARRVFPTYLQSKVVGDFCFWPEFDADGVVVAAICQMRDETEQVHIAQKSRLNEMRLDTLYQIVQRENEPQEEVMQFVVESMTRLTGSFSGYLFIPEYGEHKQPRMFWSKSHYDFLEPSALPLDALPEDCLFPSIGPDGKLNNRIIQNGDGKNPHHHSFHGKLEVMRYMHAPAMDNNRIFCLGAVCNKATDYDVQDLQQLELFLAGVWIILRRHEVVQTLQKAKEAAEFASRAKGEFLTNVSHELRTPLNGMLGMLQLLEVTPLTPQQCEYAQTASLSGKALLRIISDILDFSRMESGKMELHAIPFDIRDTVRSTVNLFTREAESRGIELYAVVDERLPPVLSGDDARVRQIIFNLVGNALKFTEHGCIYVECALLPHTRGDKIWVYLSVQDTGIGIAEAHLDSIFEAFTQVDSTSTRRHSGTGLGLGIVKRMVQMMGGTLAVESGERTGTTMHCTLAFDTAKTKGALGISPTPRPPLPGKVLDILVAEDDPVSRFTMRAFLQRTGHRIVCVSNGRQAIEALKLHPFHCLLTDIQMPSMDGLEMVQRIRSGQTADITPSKEVLEAVAEGIPEFNAKEAYAYDNGIGLAILTDLPITALTAHAMAGDRERFLDLGMDLYLSKPVIMEELNAVINELALRIG